jgi:hypothetical protein
MHSVDNHSTTACPTQCCRVTCSVCLVYGQSRQGNHQHASHADRTPGQPWQWLRLATAPPECPWRQWPRLHLGVPPAAQPSAPLPLPSAAVPTAQHQLHQATCRGTADEILCQAALEKTCCTKACTHCSAALCMWVSKGLRGHTPAGGRVQRSGHRAGSGQPEEQRKWPLLLSACQHMHIHDLMACQLVPSNVRGLLSDAMCGTCNLFTAASPAAARVAR